MKVFKLTSTDTVVAKTKKDALDHLKGMLGIEIDNNYTEDEFTKEYGLEISEIIDLENTFCYFDQNEEISELPTEQELNEIKISFKEVIERYSHCCPMHFTSEL